MPRIARQVFPDIPHHITQRGNRRENVFFTDGDRVAYLNWLAWSSAPAHCELREDSVLTADKSWINQLRSVDDWSRWLAEPDHNGQIAVLRQHVERGLPCGAERFVHELEQQGGQMLRPTAVGRPRKSELDAEA